MDFTDLQLQLRINNRSIEMDNLTAELILNIRTTVQLEPLPTVDGSNVTVPKRPQFISNSFVIDVVERINQAYKFKNLIFYISKKLNLNNPGGSEFFRVFWMKFPLVPRIIVRHSNNVSRSMMSLISTPSLVMIFTTERDDAIMEVASESLKGVHWLKTIFILFPRLSSPEYRENFETYTEFSSIIKRVLEWTWSKQFTNTLLLTIQDNVYLLAPYPTRRVVNKTERWHVDDFFKPYYTNMKGYVLSTPILYDMPRVFKGSDDKSVYGTSANYFMGFLKYVNATLQDTSANVTMKYLDLPNLLELVAQGVYETVIHSFTHLSGNYSISFSYPIGINDWCIMVPFHNQSVQELYVREALQDNVWLLLLLSTLYVSFSIWFCSPLRPRDVSIAMLQCICSITNSPPLSIMKTATPRMRYLYVLMFIMGLVTSNMYISKMASYLTSEPPPRQINTLQDIIDADLRIMVQNYEYESFIKTPEQYSERFLQQVDVVDGEVIQEHRDMLNSSFGYVVTSDRWTFINMQQGNLRKPIFRLSEVCSGPFYHVFPVHLDSHLRGPLQDFIMVTQQSGLSHHWKWEAFWEALHMRRIQLYILQEQPMPLSMSFFSSMMSVWCLGLVLAGLTFVIELKWHGYAVYLQQIWRPIW